VLIAEIGCNHRGEFDTALELVETAARFCKVDAVKLQKRNPRELLTAEEYDAPHPNPIHAYGSTYGEHREFLELDAKQHEALLELAHSLGLLYGLSVWDVTSAKEAAALGCDFVKIPSATNLNTPVLEVACAEFEGELQLSLGMTTHDEERAIVDLFDARGRASDLVLFSCTSGYPVVFEDVCLLEIERIRAAYGTRVKSVGFSGHHLGIAVDIASAVLGASHIERHFTLDRTWRGTDHAASLEPDGMRKLARDLKAVTLALQTKPSEILPVEETQRAKLKRSAASDT
jgi:sialic acid synthase SpsE